MANYGTESGNAPGIFGNSGQQNKMEHLNLELRALSLWDLTRFAWKCWCAVLLASIGVLLLAVILSRLGR